MLEIVVPILESGDISGWPLAFAIVGGLFGVAALVLAFSQFNK